MMTMHAALEPMTTLTATIKLGDLCVRCGAQAQEAWWPDICALRGIPKDWRLLCTECDIKLNSMVTRFLYKSKRDAALVDYAKVKRAEEKLE